MMNIIKTEWLKVKNYRAFWLTLIFVVIGFVLANLTAYGFINLMKKTTEMQAPKGAGNSENIKIGENVKNENDSTVSIDEALLETDTTNLKIDTSSVNNEYETVTNDLQMQMLSSLFADFQPFGKKLLWQTISSSSSWMLFLPGILIILLITNEFNFRTSRQNVIDGWSRNEFILSKFIWAILLAIISTLVLLISGLIFGLIVNKGLSTQGLKYVAAFFLKAICYNIFAVLISVLIKKQGLSILVFGGYIFLENILALVISNLLQGKNDFIKKFGKLEEYLPLSSSDSLVRFIDTPFDDLLNLPPSKDVITLCFAIFWLLVFFLLSFRVLKKNDL